MQQHRSDRIVIGHRFDQLTRAMFSERERIVAAQHYLMGPDELDEIVEYQRFVHERIKVKTIEIFSRIVRVVDRAKVGANVKSVIDAADSCGKRAPAVCEADPQLR